MEDIVWPEKAQYFAIDQDGYGAFFIDKPHIVCADHPYYRDGQWCGAVQIGESKQCKLEHDLSWVRLHRRYPRQGGTPFPIRKIHLS